jgi:predicted flap endonuclease-1-like 5' DNA nuclease
MDEKQHSNFTIGFLIGLLLCIILWYWQKSTAAEDGALELLEQVAAKERQWRKREQEGITADAPSPLSSPPAPTPQPPFDFTIIKGIGPVFNQRLHEADITSLAQLRAMSTALLAELLDIGSNRAQAILAAAQIQFGSA